MADSLALNIRERIIAFLAGELSLADFQEWLVGATWDIEERGELDALDLNYEIKLALAEHSRGDINLSELRARLHNQVEAAISS